MQRTCRIIVDPPNFGAWNMAVDEALLTGESNSNESPVIRFYQWSEPTLSLGYFQRSQDRVSHVASRGCELVRRRSGGGAILHDRELTYSFATSIEDRVSERATDYYSIFHETLIRVLSNWGVQARLAIDTDVTRHGNQAFLCFQRRSVGDVVVGDVKIAGSAQRRRKSRMIQHGSVLLAQSDCAPELPGIAEIGNTRLTREDVTNAWIGELMQEFCHVSSPEVISKSESERAHALMSVFADEAWTHRR